MSNELCPVMLFSGKGGVGKTTLAASTAVQLAEQGSRVLLVSTDPAHSLSDVFDTPLSSRPREVKPGLDAMEVDAKGMFTQGLPPDASTEEGGISRLFEMASQTPGVDEFGAIEVLLQALENAEHDVVILDTAPTGHTLRLLMLPELLDGWLGTLLQLRDQIRRAGRLFRRFLPRSTTQTAPEIELEEGLQGGRDRIAALRRVLADPDRAQIFVVTIPEAMGVLETLRTLDLLRSQHFAVGAVIVNQLQPATSDCAHCQRRRQIHERELSALRDKLGDVPLRVVESVPEEVRGCEALGRMAQRLWQGEPRA